MSRIDTGDGHVEVVPDSAELRACGDGPVLVRGAAHLRDETGAEHEVPRPVVAVCTCARSQRRPWCDGTHKVLTRAAVARTGGRAG